MLLSDKFDKSDIREAYRKLKSFVYHDNFSLFLRDRLATYETTGKIEDKLDEFCKQLNLQSKYKSLTTYFSKLVSKGVDCHLLPKKFTESSAEQFQAETVISNRFLTSSHIPERFFFFIDAPIELHLVSVLWIMRYGYLLDKRISQHSYAYKVWLDETNKDQIVKGLRLFHPYYSQYQLWRDKAIKKVKSLAEEEVDSVLISLDIKDYFHSVELDFSEMMQEIHKTSWKDKRTEKGLNLVLQEIHKAYAKKVHRNKKDYSKTILPIGLLSSGVIANWYLKKFDESVIKELNPAYYGRYVDDILIVLSNSRLDYSSKKGVGYAQQLYIKKYFTDREIFQDFDDGHLRLNGYSKLIIQSSKIRLFEVDGKESNAILENFEKKIGDNSSAFWFLPEDDAVSREFNEEANILTYSDSINKLRSIAGVHTSKYGASVFLAKKIKSALISKKKRDLKTTHQLLSFFRNRRNLDLFPLWEKVITYFVVNSQQDDFWTFYQECMDCIRNIVPADSGERGECDSNIVNKLGTSLVQYFELCLSMALALHPKFVNEELYQKIKGALPTPRINLINIYEKARSFRQANMMRHHYVVHPLLNYTKHCYKNAETLSLIERSYPTEIGSNEFEIFSYAKRYSPRYIHLHEATSLLYYKFINETADQIFSKGSGENKGMTSKIIGDSKLLNDSFDLFRDINYDYSFEKSKSVRENMREAYFKSSIIKENGDGSPIKCESIYSNGDNSPLQRLSVVVANHKIFSQHVEQSISSRSNLSASKKENLIKLLNEAERLKGDMLVLPENCVPFSWMSLIIDESRNKQRAIICGLEHLNVSGVVFNFILSVLPIKVGGIHDVIVVLRLKNHYSPYEDFLIKGLGLLVPVPSPYRYHLLKWRGVCFSVYNCFELADIEHRALFRSKVDLLVASEYNKDINYFSNIVESVTRDVHCYFVQVNSSDYGDSRVTTPSNTQKINILRLKGGENSTALKVTLDIEALRSFQKKYYGLQKETSDFKPTPPNYDHKAAKQRGQD